MSQTVDTVTTLAEKFVARTAYARNGNAHNPTQYHEWLACLVVNGQRIVLGQTRRRRDALAWAQEVAADAALVRSIWSDHCRRA